MRAEALHRSSLDDASPRSIRTAVSLADTTQRGLGSAALPALLTLAIAALTVATCTTREATPVDVTIRDVVTDPYALDGKLVRLFGLLHQTADGDALYWHRADVERSIHSHAIAVRYSSPSQIEAPADGTYVTLEGTFVACEPQGSGTSADAIREGEQFNGALVDARHVHVR